MLVVRTISAGVTPYFVDGRDPGSWTPATGRLLGLGGPVGGPDLRAVLRGTDPRTGAFLPAVRHPRRRSGWDLIFSAPKSLSLLAGTSAEGESVAGAHTAAVGQVLEDLEQHLSVRDATAPGGHRPAGGLIAARFEHRANAASEPHLHTHVLVANLTRTARGWSGVENRAWFVGRSRLGALYQLALRSELGARGWDLEWRLRADGLADLAGVPSPAVRAVSTQGRRAAAVGRLPARRQASPQAWRERAEQAGYDWRTAPQTGGLSSRPAAAGRDLEDRDLASRVTTRLAMRRSDFRESDVIVAMAATMQHGCRPEQAAGWAERFCAAAHPVASPTSGRRWTSALARRADDRLVAVLEEMQAERTRAGPGRPPGSTGSPARVTVLASPPGRTDLMAQADYLERCLVEWEREGMTAAVAARTGLASARWEVLTGLAPHRPGMPVEVLVVDQADRRSTPELLQLLEAARTRVDRLILVEGGTLPRLSNPASRGLADFTARAGARRCPPAPVWQPGPTPADDRSPNRSGRQAAYDLLARWAGGSRRELLVGLGLEEVHALNRAARLLTTGGPGRAPAGAGAALPAAGGPEAGPGGGFATGDRVVVLRGGEHRRPYGTFGDIVDLDPSGRRLAIRWDGERRAAVFGPEVLCGLGHGWAGTVNLASSSGRDVLLLGSLQAAPRLRSLVRASIEPERPAGHELYRGRPL